MILYMVVYTTMISCLFLQDMLYFVFNNSKTTDTDCGSLQSTTLLQFLALDMVQLKHEASIKHQRLGNNSLNTAVKHVASGTSDLLL